jgi:hypothetical protein
MKKQKLTLIQDVDVERRGQPKIALLVKLVMCPDSGEKVVGNSFS